MTKLFLIALFAVVYLASMHAAPVEGDKELYDLDRANEVFEKYIKDFNKEYKDEADKQAHFVYFKESLQRINEVNNANLSWTAGLNQFADLSPEENRQHTGLRLPESQENGDSAKPSPLFGK